jgi:hypothetical protein
VPASPSSNSGVVWTRMRILLCFGYACSALLLSSCSGSDSDEVPVSLTNGCDIRSSNCQEAIFRATADIREQSNAQMPNVRTISVDQFSQVLGSQDMSGGGLDAWGPVLPLLRLLPAGKSLAEEQTSTAAAEIAAFYDPQTKQVTVIDRGSMDPLNDMFILSHEFVHSLQDNAVDLTAFQTQWASSLDSWIAVRSLVEGEATVLAYSMLAKARGPSTVINWTFVNSTLRQNIFDAIATSPAPLVMAQQGLPYPLGTAQLAPLWSGGGPRAFDALYAAPAQSVLDWADDTRVTAASRVERLDCLPTLGPPGFTGYDSESFGPTGLLSVALASGANQDDAWAKALHFRGDRAVLFTEDGVADSYAVAWRIRFDSDAAANTFVSDAKHLVGGTAVSVANREVVYFGTTNADRFPTWTEPTHCGTMSELPSRPPTRQAGNPILLELESHQQIDYGHLRSVEGGVR